MCGGEFDCWKASMILVFFFTMVKKGSLWHIEAIGNLRLRSRLQFVFAFDCHNNHSVCFVGTES